MFREYVSFGEGMYVYVCKMDVCIYMYIEIWYIFSNKM